MEFGIDEQAVVREVKTMEDKKAREVIEKDIALNEMYEKQTTKGGFFNRKKAKKKEYSPNVVDSENTWREINLFIPEAISIAVALVAGIILMFVVRFISATGIELIREMLTDQAYLEVSALLNTVNTLFLGVAALPFLILVGFFLYRLFVFMPRRNRYPVLRIKRTGAIKFTVDSIKDHEMSFEKGFMGDKMKVVNPRKHWFENTGKPCIVLIEGDDSNADLNVLAGNVSAKAKDTTTINDMAFQDGRRFERMNMENAGKLLTPMNIILILILGAVGLVLFLVLKNPETTAQIIGQAPVAMGMF
jgi:hypothetical protein